MQRVIIFKNWYLQASDLSFTIDIFVKKYIEAYTKSSMFDSKIILQKYNIR